MVGDANWTVADGAVQATTGTGFLVTPCPYGDFQITLDFWVTDDANSGVFIRCEDPKTITAMNAYEVNIFDKRPDQTLSDRRHRRCRQAGERRHDRRQVEHDRHHRARARS